MNLDDALHTFVEESRELLTEMESSLLQLQQHPSDGEGIHAIFRAAHTIKGSAGLFGLDALVRFTHVAETLLDEVRAGGQPLSASLIELLLACCDHLHDLVDATEAGSLNDSSPLHPRSQALCAQLQQYVCAGATAPLCTTTVDLNASPATPEIQRWHIAIQFGPAVLQNGMDPLSFVRYLHTLGTVTHTQLNASAVPPLDALDAEQCYLGLTLDIDTSAPLAELESVFEFVRDDCTLSITPVHVDSPPTAAPAMALPNPVAAPVTPARDPLDATPADLQPLHSAKPRVTDTTSVRVDAHKLDQLIDLVGELIIASAGAAEVARQLKHSAMLEANATVADLVEQVRDQALQLRMVKIGGTFNKFQRVVHDVARELGKDIVLAISGEDTELDKTVVERIGDPLTHLVRNAMDHGIEPAEVRVARGKPAQGTVQLNAFHESGHIVIEISDDGGGLDRDRILAKGVERGLVEPGRTLSDKEIYALIFEPGFSTAEQVTQLSGRGVGMDVVRSNITALRGTVELSSQPGVGTTVQVRLPLTLAIIHGFQVRVGHSVMVIPLEMVDECIEYTGDPQHHYTDLRGSVLPFIALREHFQLEGPRSARPNIVVIHHGRERLGLLVDELLGEAQTVIKPLSRIFHRAQGISGSSILGNGSVALILDIPVLHQQILLRQPTTAFDSSA